ncbi:MAG: FHA domain-containing protein [Terrimicrobiaceae bacterium]|jgi:pSer/pThr/pTyr-binding forkhead associated (FHA) protein
MAKLHLYLPDGTQQVRDLTEETLTIGRLADNGLHIDDASVSSHHGEITFEAGEWHLHDSGSTNGTFINGERVTDAVLRHGDELRIGAIETVFSSEDGQLEQPLPESSTAAAEVAGASKRPSAFKSSSPIPKNIRTKDPLAAVLIGAAVIGILAFGGATFFILQMVAP